MNNNNNNNISFSRVETCMTMQPKYSNAGGNIHGGELMKIMDNVGGLAAYKHAKGVVVTARVDEIVFHKPVHIGNILTCVGQLAYVGNSSLQVIVTMYVHDVKNYSNPEIAMSAFVTMVHLVNNKPAKAPKLVPTTKEEEELFRLGEKKYNEIKGKYINK